MTKVLFVLLLILAIIGAVTLVVLCKKFLRNKIDKYNRKRRNKLIRKRLEAINGRKRNGTRRLQ